MSESDAPHCDHEHTEDGARIYTPEDIAKHVTDDLTECETPVLAYAVVAVHEHSDPSGDNKSKIPPVTVIGHKHDPHAVVAILAMGQMSVSFVTIEQEMQEERAAEKFADTLTQVLSKSLFPNGDPGDLHLPPDAMPI